MFNEVGTGKLPEFQQKMILLRIALQRDGKYKTDSDDRFIFFHKNDENRKDFYRRKMDNWCAGDRPNTSLLPLSRKISEMYNIRDEKTGDLVRSDILNVTRGAGVTELGKWLGFDNSQISYYIDRAMGEILPTISMFSMTNTKARAVTESYAGLYIIYRVDGLDTDNTVITQIPLAIRYLLPTNKKNAKDEYRIRCRARVPAARGETNDYDYDGWMSHTTAAIFFLFEMRAPSAGQKDMLFITANPEQQNSKLEKFIRGDALSRSMNVESAQHWPLIFIKDERYKAHDTYDGNGYSWIEDTTGVIWEDVESHFFQKNCKMIPLEEFEKTTVLQYLVKRNTVTVKVKEQ